MGFLLSYDGEIREPFVLPQGIPVPIPLAGERGIALQSWRGNRASICAEGGISRSFLICGRKLWVPSSCDGDLRELLMVPMGSQESFQVVRSLSGFLWGWCNGRGPHLQLRREPQGSSPFLTLIAGSLQSWNRKVRPHLLLRDGTPLASRVVHGLTGHLSSCI